MAENDYVLDDALNRLDSAESDISTNSDEIDSLEQGLIPVAGITAWDKNLTDESLPDRFVECDGSTINDSESPLDGETVPDLNGDNRILKGNSSSGGTDSFDTDGDNTDNTEDTFDVVWVMRVK